MLSVAVGLLKRNLSEIKKGQRCGELQKLPKGVERNRLTITYSAPVIDLPVGRSEY